MRLGFARVAGEIELESGNPSWAEVRAVIDDDHRGLPAYDLPLLMVAARVLASVIAGCGTVDLDTTAAESQLRTALTRDSR